jgi:hypothetical protein
MKDANAVRSVPNTNLCNFLDMRVFP